VLCWRALFVLYCPFCAVSAICGAIFSEKVLSSISTLFGTELGASIKKNREKIAQKKQKMMALFLR
jgi:hypothetical protein